MTSKKSLQELKLTLSLSFSILSKVSKPSISLAKKKNTPSDQATKQTRSEEMRQVKVLSAWIEDYFVSLKILFTFAQQTRFRFQKLCIKLSLHLPKVVYTPFKWGCLEYLPASTFHWSMQPIYTLLWGKQLGHVMKNWLPLVFGPVFTIDKQPEKTAGWLHWKWHPIKSTNQFE